LIAEWESFEKLIQGGNDEQAKPLTTELDEGGAPSTDLLKKTASTSHAADQPVTSKLEVRRKRVFREVQSDSNGTGNSDSEDESHPILPTAGMNSGCKVDAQSSSSDSSQSPEKEFPSRSALYDTDSSSDDEKPTNTKPSKLPTGKCDVLVIINLLLLYIL